MSSSEVGRQFFEVYERHATGRDIVFGGHCRLRLQQDGKVIPLTGNFIDSNPDGIFPDFTYSLAVKALEESYKQPGCQSLYALLLNNVEIGRDTRTLTGESDFRRRRAEALLADYILDLREEWPDLGIPKEALAWFPLGQEWLPFALESHFRSLMDRRVGSLTTERDCVVVEERAEGRFYYYSPAPERKYLVTSFGQNDNPAPEFAPVGAICQGTGCAGEVAILVREADKYRLRGNNEQFRPGVVFNLAPMICYEPVNIGTEFAYDVFAPRLKTVNVFFDPPCEQMLVEVFEP
jgi:hypothetical protein